MLGAEEKRRLMSRFAGEPLRPLAAVMKCVAALLLLVVLAAGPWAFLTTGGVPIARTPSAPPQADRGMAESRRVYEERRERHESGHEAVTAGAKKMPDAPRLTDSSAEP